MRHNGRDGQVEGENVHNRGVTPERKTLTPALHDRFSAALLPILHSGSSRSLEKRRIGVFLDVSWIGQYRQR